MKCVWWLVYTWSLVTVSSEAMLKEGDNYSLECSSPGWKYCSWRHEVSGGGGDDDEGGGGGDDDDDWQSYSCDRTSSTAVEWCNRSLGLRWSQGEACGLDLVSLSLEQAGRWEATLLQGPHLNISHTCQQEPRVAERARLSVLQCQGGEPCRHLAGRTEVVTCLSQGGQPRPVVQAFLTRGHQRRPLQVNQTVQTSDKHFSHPFPHFSPPGRI